MGLDDPDVPKAGIRTDEAEDVEIDLRRRASRPPSRSRRRIGGAAGAVLVIVLGTGTLGALPARQVDVRGHVISRVAESSSGPIAGTGTDVGAQVLADLGVDPSPAPGTSQAADPGTYEQREAQFTSALPDQRAQIAIRTAMAQIGLPYVWGGDGPTNGDAGFDCSGLTTFAYAAAGVGLPRTAHTQYYKGPHVPQGAPLQPGDLVFYGTPAKVHHVGLYLGDGKMINAPTFGKPVQVAFYRYGGDDYLGATRPAATGQTSSGLLPYAPPAPSTGTPETFPAPVAPAPTAVPNATAPAPVESATTTTSAPPVTTITVTVTATPTAPKVDTSSKSAEPDPSTETTPETEESTETSEETETEETETETESASESATEPADIVTTTAPPSS